MSFSIITPASDESLEAFLPLSRVKDLCFINHTRRDAALRDYRRAAFEAGQDLARSSFLPQTIEASFRTPYATTKNFGLEGKVVDYDGVQGALRLQRGPVLSITHVKFLDAGGAVDGEPLDPASYTIEAGRFVRWAANYVWPNNPGFTVRYQAGITDATKLATLRVAVGELLAVMWDSAGGGYAVPTSAQRVFRAMRPSATYVPGPLS